MEWQRTTIGIIALYRRLHYITTRKTVFSVMSSQSFHAISRKLYEGCLGIW